MQNTKLEARALKLDLDQLDNDTARLIPLVKFISAADLVLQPKPLEWAIRGVLLKGTTIAMIGAPGTYKSSVEISMASCIATGIDWHGRAVSQGAVFYLAGEGNAGIARRLKAWEIENKSLDGAPLYVSTGGIGLVDPMNAAAVAEEVERLAAEHNMTPALVIVDTLARNFGAGDENSTADMGRFIANLDRHVREPFGCTVKIVHHTGLADGGRARGSSSLRAAVDTEILLERVGDVVTMRCTKSKDAPEFEPIAFQPRAVELPWDGEDGMPETSFVLMPTDMPSGALSPRFGRHEEKAMACLERLYDDAKATLAVGGRADAQPLVRIDEWRDACGFDRKQRFYEIKKSLEKKEAIRINYPHVLLAEQSPVTVGNGLSNGR